MGEIVNLKQVRKTRARAEKDQAAQANRVAHGTPKALKKLEQARQERTAERLTGHWLEKERNVAKSRSDQKPDDN